jgi:hypothetical protein
MKPVLTKDQKKTWTKLCMNYEKVFEELEGTLANANEAMDDYGWQLEDRASDLSVVGDALVEFAVGIIADLEARQQNLEGDSEQWEELNTLVEKWIAVADEEFSFEAEFNHVEHYLEFTPDELYTLNNPTK